MSLCIHVPVQVKILRNSESIVIRVLLPLKINNNIYSTSRVFNVIHVRCLSVMPIDTDIILMNTGTSYYDM